jgi:DNA-binding PadR family transcriptional regulator
MPPVFGHGRLRLYLLKLLEEAPRHGYEVIRLLEERFQGLYAPSAGTVYPRLAKLETEGLVTHTTEGGRKVYSLTAAGRAELADRQAELAELELEISESLASLAADIREDVSGSAHDLRTEMREQARSARGDRRRGAGPGWSGGPWDPGNWEGMARGDKDAWRQAKEELKRAKQEWKEQARRARQDADRARSQARQEREAHEEAIEHLRKVAHQVQDQVRTQARSGDWAGAVQTGLGEFMREMGDLGLGRPGRPHADGPSFVKPDQPAGPVPDWADPDDAATSTGEPARDLERLLDRFRDDVRDAARDHGVDGAQLGEVRRHLAAAAAHIVAALRGGAKG